MDVCIWLSTFEGAFATSVWSHWIHFLVWISPLSSSLLCGAYISDSFGNSPPFILVVYSPLLVYHSHLLSYMNKNIIHWCDKLLKIYESLNYVNSHYFILQKNNGLVPKKWLNEHKTIQVNFTLKNTHCEHKSLIFLES